MACALCRPIVITVRVEPDNQPCSTRCQQCSRCVRSMAYWARGGRDYLGVDGERQMAQAAQETAA